MAQKGMIWIATFVSQIQMHLAEIWEYKRKKGREKISGAQVTKILDEYPTEDRKLMQLIVLMMRGLKEPCNDLAYYYFDDLKWIANNHAKIERRNNIVDVEIIIKQNNK